MIPTIAASTGAPFFPSASPAARPSSTISTFSSTPAPTPSTASSVDPRGESSGFSGCTSSSFAPSNLRCFCVETTVPTTRAICIEDQPPRLPDVPVIDNADDTGIHWRFERIERKTGLLAANEKHFLAHAGPDAIDGDQRLARRLTVGSERLHEQQRHPDEVFVFTRDDDRPHDFGELHVQSLTVTASMTPM